MPLNFAPHCYIYIQQLDNILKACIFLLVSLLLVSVNLLTWKIRKTLSCEQNAIPLNVSVYIVVHSPCEAVVQLELTTRTRADEADYLYLVYQQPVGNFVNTKGNEVVIA